MVTASSQNASKGQENPRRWRLPLSLLSVGLLLFGYAWLQPESGEGFYSLIPTGDSTVRVAGTGYLYGHSLTESDTYTVWRERPSSGRGGHNWEEILDGILLLRERDGWIAAVTETGDRVLIDTHAQQMYTGPFDSLANSGSLMQLFEDIGEPGPTCRYHLMVLASMFLLCGLAISVYFAIASVREDGKR